MLQQACSARHKPWMLGLSIKMEAISMAVDSVSGQIPSFISGFLRKPRAASLASAAGAKSFTAQMAKLNKARPHNEGNGASPKLLEDVMAAANPEKARSAQVALQNLSNAKPAATNPMVALEGTLMTKFVDEMLPKSSHALYGEGLAGDTWRGFEVDQLGSALAKSDPLNFSPVPTTIRLSANGSMNNLFGNTTEGQSTSRPVLPFST
jgi:hypothetical protein